MKLFGTDGKGNCYNPKYRERQVSKPNKPRNCNGNYEDSQAGDFWRKYDQEHGLLKQPKKVVAKPAKPQYDFTFEDGSKGLIVLNQKLFVVVQRAKDSTLVAIPKHKMGWL